MFNMRWPKDSNLRRINHVLLACCLIINGYIALGPLWPQASYAIDTKITKPVDLNPAKKSDVSQIDRSINHVIIPSLQLDEVIHEGPDARTLNEGLWHRPATSTPGKGSNTVIVGHRYTYSGETPFYRLDKLALGEDVIVVYDHVVYRYRVDQSETVDPSQVSVEAASAKPELTLYTCTPLWSFNQRLVYHASLQEKL